MSFLSKIGLGGLDKALKDLDRSVRKNLPGGWLAPIAVGAAAFTGGTSLAALGTAEAAAVGVAEAATVATAAEVGAGFEAYMAANGVTAATASSGAAAFAEMAGSGTTAAMQGGFADVAVTEAVGSGTTAAMQGGFGEVAAKSSLTLKEAVTGANTGLNVLGAAAKISALNNQGSLMKITTPTASAMISPSPIDTGQVLATTPQGPILTSTSQAADNGIGNKELMIMAAAGAALYFIWKKGA